MEKWFVFIFFVCILSVLENRLLRVCSCLTAFIWLNALRDAGDHRWSVFSPKIGIIRQLQSLVCRGSTLLGTWGPFSSAERKIPLTYLWCCTLRLQNLCQMKVVHMKKQSHYITACLGQTMINIIKIFSTNFSHTKFKWYIFSIHDDFHFFNRLIYKYMYY